MDARDRSTRLAAGAGAHAAKEGAVAGSKQAERSVAELANDLGSTAAELYERLDLPRQMRDHPYRTLAMAAGIGYVIGGGLFTPLTPTLVRVGARAALVPMRGTLGAMAADEVDEENQRLF